MRLDKFLWAVRLYKTRSLATKDCGAGKITINGEKAKAAKVVQPLDEFAVKTNPIWRSYRILDLPKSRISAKLVPEYVIETTSPENLHTLEQVQLMDRSKRQEGLKGRPTKKDRRDLNNFTS